MPHLLPNQWFVRSHCDCHSFHYGVKPDCGWGGPISHFYWGSICQFFVGCVIIASFYFQRSQVGIRADVWQLKECSPFLAQSAVTVKTGVLVEGFSAARPPHCVHWAGSPDPRPSPTAAASFNHEEQTTACSSLLRVCSVNCYNIKRHILK